MTSDEETDEIETRAVLSAAGLGGQTLKVAFVRSGDRTGHAIGVETSGGSGPASFVPLLHSLEGTSDESWPASSALQSLSIEDLPDGRPVALLVGMAGRSHWSASMEALATPAAFVFDHACRTSQTADFLGSSYRLASGVEVDEAAGNSSQWGIVCGDVRLTLIAEPAGDFPPPRIECRDDAIVLHAAADGQKTIRWKYRLLLG